MLMAIHVQRVSLGETSGVGALVRLQLPSGDAADWKELYTTLAVELRRGARGVLINLRFASHLKPEHLPLLLDMLRLTWSSGAELLLCELSPESFSLLKGARLEEVLPHVGTEGKALAQLRQILGPTL
jgi:anti-anti-sigma regulatory factor